MKSEKRFTLQLLACEVNPQQCFRTPFLTIVYYFILTMFLLLSCMRIREPINADLPFIFRMSMSVVLCLFKQTSLLTLVVNHALFTLIITMHDVILACIHALMCHNNFIIFQFGMRHSSFKEASQLLRL